jgi:uncharacterized protein (DUF1697 family)
MTTYIALLRGINVGGKNIIKMFDLKEAFEALGFRNVKTYIQSGNIIFLSDKKEDILQNIIVQKIIEAFGFSVSVILRTAQEINQILQDCPFTDDEIKEAEDLANVENFPKVECLYIAFLPQQPSKEKIESLEVYRNKGDQFHISGRNIYLLFHHSIRDSKLAGNLHRLDLPSTVRNWNTVMKLAELAKVLDD